MKFIVILMAVARFSPIAVIILNMYITDIRTIMMIFLEARKWQMKGYCGVKRCVRQLTLRGTNIRRPGDHLMPRLKNVA